ncbi:MAG: COG4705 family protein [Bdellovibrionota bacterium]
MRENSMLEEAFSKVPEVTFGFWVIKIIATTLGEVGGNAVSLTMDLGYFLGSVIFGVPLLIAVAVQIKAKKFNSSLYWLVITLTTLAGTTLADFFDRSLGIGYLGGSLSLFSLVMLTLGLWHRSMGSVDIETVITPKAEIFYWTTIMFSQTLGTALGDWMADSTGLGYNGSALLIGAVLAVLAACYYFTKANRTLLFWAAFILTRPLGAVVANSFDKPLEKGGLGISDITMTAALAVAMVIGLLVIPQRSGRH